MRTIPVFLLLVQALALAACAPAPPPEPPPPLMPLAPVDPTPGFNDKEPDTCKAAGLSGLVGQPAGNARTVALPGPSRVIAPGQVVDQNEYRSNRINFHTDAAGVILRIDCG